MMGLFSILLGMTDDNEKKNKLDLKIEQEMEWNNFDEYEKEEVRKGNYDVYNFEDSNDVELDEDDYYSEDRR